MCLEYLAKAVEPYGRPELRKFPILKQNSLVGAAGWAVSYFLATSLTPRSTEIQMVEPLRDECSVTPREQLGATPLGVMRAPL